MSRVKRMTQHCAKRLIVGRERCLAVQIGRGSEERGGRGAGNVSSLHRGEAYAVETW